MATNVQTETQQTTPNRFVRGLSAVGRFIYNLPAYTVTTVTHFILGNPEIEIDSSMFRGNIKDVVRYYDNEGEPQAREATVWDRLRQLGLVGTLTMAGRFIIEAVSAGVILVAQGLSSFVSQHQTAITRGFWITLGVAGALAATAAVVAFAWPAAFAAVVGFSVAGVSIASLAGATGLLGQIGIIAALGGVASVLGTTVVATIANTINWIKSCCTKQQHSTAEVNEDISDFAAQMQTNSLASHQPPYQGPSTQRTLFQPLQVNTNEVAAPPTTFTFQP